MPGREDLGENKSRSDIVTGVNSKTAGQLSLPSLVTSCWIVHRAPPIGLAPWPPRYLTTIPAGDKLYHQYQPQHLASFQSGPLWASDTCRSLPFCPPLLCLSNAGLPPWSPHLQFLVILHHIPVFLWIWDPLLNPGLLYHDSDICLACLWPVLFSRGLYSAAHTPAGNLLKLWYTLASPFMLDCLVLIASWTLPW